MRKCKVFVNGIEAGVLTEDDNPRIYIFRYNKTYLKSGRQPVCLAMPVSKGEFRSDTLFPFFSNLLSEGENRVMQASLYNLDNDDDFGILLATAQYDTVGAVTVKPITENP